MDFTSVTNLAFLTLASLMVFYVFYLACMALYRGHKDGTLTMASKVLGYPILLVGLALDVAANIAIFSAAFLEPPREWLVTSRLKRHVKRAGWRGRFARYICHHLLSPFDPTGDHCD